MRHSNAEWKTRLNERGIYIPSISGPKKLQITIKSYIDISATITVGDVR